MKILNALSLGDQGVQIARGKNMYLVSTKYDPIVAGVGRTIDEAANDCVNWLYDVAKDHPHYKVDLTKVFEALEKP